MTGRSGPSVVQLRVRRAKPARLVNLVVTTLRDAEAALGAGALVTIDAESVRVRLLPFPPKPQHN
jgi:predicted nuclease of predicted toxin-antitoxin system